MGSLLGDGSDDIPRSPNLKRKGTAFKNSADAHNMNKRKKDHDSSKSEVLTMPMGGGGQQLQQDTGAAGGGLGGHQHAHDTQTQARVLRSTPSSLKKVQTKEVCTAIERKNMQKDSKNLQKGKKRAFTSADGDTHMLQTPPTIPYGHVSPHTLPKNDKAKSPFPGGASASTNSGSGAKDRPHDLRMKMGKKNLEDVAAGKREAGPAKPTQAPGGVVTRNVAIKSETSPNTGAAGLKSVNSSIYSTPKPKSLQEPGISPFENKQTKNPNPCNCKRSRCLKLYCECFARKEFCNGCNCLDCKNNPANEQLLRDSVKMAEERNPKAFAPKIESTQHSSGCHCKKSRCVKKYCECFQNKILCTSKCKCIDCDNGPKHGGNESTEQTMVTTTKKNTKSNSSSKKKQQQVLNSASKSALSKGTANILGGLSGKSSLLTGKPTSSTSTTNAPLALQTNGGAAAAANWQQRVIHQMKNQQSMGSSSSSMSQPKMDLGAGDYFSNGSTTAVSFQLPTDTHGANKTMQIPRSIMSSGESMHRAAHTARRFWFFATRDACESFCTDVFLYLNNVDLFNALLVSCQWKELALSNDIWHYPSDDSQEDAMSETLPNVSDYEDSNSAWENNNYLSLTSDEVLDQNVDISSYLVFQ